MADGASSRVARLSIEEAREVATSLGLADAYAELSVFRVLLRHPRLAQAVAGLLNTLLFRGKLSPRLRELLIMRIGWVTGSEYEWTQHWRVARALDLPEEDLLAVRDWRASDRFDEADRAVLAATDETLESGAISEATWKQCAAHVGGVEERLELVVAIGNWRLFSSLLRSLEIPLEEGTEGWPPDGRRPQASGS
ncbi:MAG: carboxymuconolactone decarboxylase family protein [Myxococcota bacterium]|nr:carboxymuconolactone decarboxylase family protein [Myxococcota bacterium]